MQYIINLVLINKDEELIDKQISIQCLAIYDKLYKALYHINNLENIYLNLAPENIINITNKIPTNKDVDGIYLINDDENSHKFNVYKKKSELNSGYIYNSVEININYIGFIEIIMQNYNIIDINNNLDNTNNNNKLNKNTLIKINQQKFKKKRDEINDKMLNELKNKLKFLSKKRK